MANRYRGEICAVLDGKRYALCLTLGGLAELESLFGETDMVALASRFESGRIRALDAQRIIGAGLRGGGFDISDEAVAGMKVEDGAAGYVDVVARLLQATFGGGDGGGDVGGDDGAGVPAVGEVSVPSKEGGAHVPFPGTTS